MITEPVLILVATMGGTATFVADEMADALKAKGIKPFLVPMEKAALAMFDTRKLFIICSSTHGNGDIPDNSVAFFDALRDQRPDLSDVRYGTVALGDMTYSASFCGGGAQFDDLFADLGATRLVDRLEHDRQGGTFPEEEAVAWLDGWLEAANAHQPA
ncbi:MioC protein [Sphingobium sp. AP50]|uniref:flavodoxin domain-containing protein n=1 Tax=Sphingobium sp. AP50 TaxID=1884369 RepID=UPI0008B7A915|nr:flavodoxin domain-containing protein [Sphingobium sp. AP50]SEK00312.1 MioC protein [Sphingobium sp. AP50]